MNFSKYTYSGLKFYGFGIEIKPKNSLFKFAAFRGRLSKKITPDTLGTAQVKPAYHRVGWGVKLDFGQKGQDISLIAFHAKDDLNSFDSLSPIYKVKPQENMVFGIEAKNKLGKRIQTKIEYTMSAYTADLRAPERDGEVEYNYFNNIGQNFSPLLSTRYNKSLSLDGKYKGDFWTMGANYLRIDPTYVSLGSLAAKNDVQAYTLNGSIQFFKNKMTLAGNFGTEKNNLADNLSLSMNRIIYGGNIALNIIKNLTLTADYSNFNHSTTPSLINFVDTVKLMQVNDSKNFVATYTLGESVLKHTIMANASYLNGEDIREYETNQDVKTSKVNNYIGNYNITHNEWLAGAALGFLYSNVEADTITTTSSGPSFMVNKKWLDKKLTTTFSTSYLSNSLQEEKQGNTLNFKIGMMYKQGKHSFKWDNAIVKKKDEITAIQILSFFAIN